MTQLRKRMLEELQRRNYSQATTRSYILAVKQFAEYFGQSPEKLGAEEIRRYQLYLLNEKKLTPGTVGIRMSALRFLYKKTLKRRDLAFDDLVYPKKPKKLPVVLSPEEIARLSIRRTEASLLKVNDIDSQRMVIHIHQGKGSRDRDVPLRPKLLEALREYWRWKKPKDYLFPSTAGHRGLEQPISDKTVWNICKEAAVRGLVRDSAFKRNNHSYPTSAARVVYRGAVRRNLDGTVVMSHGASNFAIVSRNRGRSDIIPVNYHPKNTRRAER